MVSGHFGLLSLIVDDSPHVRDRKIGPKLKRACIGAPLASQFGVLGDETISFGGSHHKDACTTRSTMMSNYITFDLTKLEGIGARSDLDRLEAAFRCHPAVLSELPVVLEDQEFKEEEPRYLLACFDYMESMKRILQLASWIYEDALAAKAQHLENTTEQLLSTSSPFEPSILGTNTGGEDYDNKCESSEHLENGMKLSARSGIIADSLSLCM